MAHRIMVATAFAAASLFTSGAYAGSPYYDANGQSMAQPAVHAPAHVRKMARPAHSAAATRPGFDSEGFAEPAANAEFFDHAVGTDGSSVASGAAAPEPAAAPAYTAAAPKMDADGFQHPESDSSFYEHAVGTMGTP